MDYKFPPELLSLDNAAEEFWQDYRRKQGFPVAQSESGSTDSLWADAHMRFHFPEQFPALPKKKRFSWAGFLALLAVALVVGWMVYQAVEAF